MNFGCVVVTYNRLDKLNKCLQSYDEQLSKDDVLIVVDNGSNNDTYEYLNMWALEERQLCKHLYLRLNDNGGGAFGFKKGLEKAKELNLDWCMISDDDAFLSDGFICTCKDDIKKYGNYYGAICSKVVYPNGDIQFLHRRYLHKGLLSIKETDSSNTDYEKDSFNVNLFSFVGVCIRMDVIDSVGYPDDSYFIWYDDTDLSIRVNSKYKIGCFNNMTIIHDCGNNGANNIVTFKEYYGYRNKLITLKKYYSSRYYIFYLLILKLRCISNTKKCPSRVGIIKDSIKDFKNGITGKRKDYLPGSFISK